MLARFGAIPTEGRVVEDGDVLTGGGMTAGLDVGVTLAERLRGRDWASRVMLTIEYEPEPPFTGGSPATADARYVDAVLDRRRAVLDEASRVVDLAASRL